MKNAVSEMKNMLEGTGSRLDGAEDWISDLKDKVAENTQWEQHKLKKKKFKARIV